MYERFTDRARKVMVLANREAERFGHEYIGTEHWLLGLIAEGSGVAANVLKNLGLELEQVRQEVERTVQNGNQIYEPLFGTDPNVPAAKKAIENAMLESRALNHNYVGTEHILLGLLHDADGVAGRVLRNLGLKLDDVRQVVLTLLGHGIEFEGRAIPQSPATARKKPVRKLFDAPDASLTTYVSSQSVPLHAPGTLIAVDIGNSRIKLGRFERRANAEEAAPLPEPTVVGSLPIKNKTGDFEIDPFDAWCSEHVGDGSTWVIGSVHRGAADRLTAAVASWAKKLELRCGVRWLTYQDVPLAVAVEQPERVGIDRLLGALAASRLREAGRAAIVVDSGSAITVDLLTADGGFAGGAILPGVGMSARALAEQTDALPLVRIDDFSALPAVPGKSTVPAMAAGLYWGTVGAIRELVDRLSEGIEPKPQVFLTGGGIDHMADILAADRPAQHVSHLVLSGIALTAESLQ